MDLRIFKDWVVNSLLDHPRILDIGNREDRLQCDAVGFLFVIDDVKFLLLGDAMNLKNIRYIDDEGIEHFINITKHNTSIKAIDQFIERHQTGEALKISLGFRDDDSAIWLISNGDKLSDELTQSGGIDYIVENYEDVIGVVFVKSEYQDGIRLENNVEVSVIPERSELVRDVTLY